MKWPDLNKHLKIDEIKAVEGIKTYLQRVYDEHHASGVLLGLSGGIDSAVLAALVVDSLGKNFVHLAYLFDQHSEQVCHRNARIVTDWLGLELEEKSIEPAMREMGV